MKTNVKISFTKRSCSNIDIVTKVKKKLECQSDKKKYHKSRNFYDSTKRSERSRKYSSVASSRKQGKKAQPPLSHAQNNYFDKSYRSYLAQKPMGFDSIREKFFKTIHGWGKKGDNKMIRWEAEVGSNVSSSKESLDPIYTAIC